MGEFLAALDDRWQGLSRDDLLAALVGHAQRLAVRHRQEFLDIFPAPGSVPVEPGPTPGTDLLGDIDAFAARAVTGEDADDEDHYPHRYGWVDDQDEAWVGEADELFAAVGEVFVVGDLATARTAYERLLASFGVGEDGAGQLDLWLLESTDVRETLARYLRCIYETTALEGRAAAVHLACLALPGYGLPGLVELASACRDPLPDLDRFLPDWIELLLTETARPPLRERVRLLVEAATMGGGVDGLTEIARHPGPHQGDVGLARIDALAAAGRLHDARTAAAETRDTPGVDVRHRAAAADRLADLASTLGDHDAAVRSRRDAWNGEPTRRRLLALAAGCRAAGVLAETFAAEADALTSAGSADGGVGRRGCELLLLAGRIDQAAGALVAADPLGWHHTTHPGPVVLPFLWAAAMGAAPAPAAGHLGRMFATIDDEVDVMARFDAFTTRDPRPDRGSARTAHTEPALTALLADTVRNLAADDHDRERWRTTAAAVADARIAAIVSGKHRGAYARAASLAFANAETLAGLGRSAEADSYLAAVRARFPRHVAFRGELDAAAGSSTLRGRHPRGTGR